MKKIFLNTLTPEEIISRLKKGEVAKVKNFDTIFKMIDGVIVRIEEDGDCDIGYYLDINYMDDYYFEEEKKFEITETGLYRTLDGRKAFVSCIDTDNKIVGLIDGEAQPFTWLPDGRSHDDIFARSDDIISKWEE